MSEDLARGLELTLVGFAIVFLVLTVIALIVLVIQRADRGWQHREHVEAIQRLARPPSIDATTAVVIAAAVATYVSGRHRIRSVRRMLPGNAPSSPWSAQGRAVLQGSHALSRRSHR